MRLFFKAILEGHMPLSELEDRIGITWNQMDDPAFFTSFDKVDALAKMAITESGNPALALHIFSKFPKIDYGISHHVAKHSNTLREAIEYLSRYAEVDSDISRISLIQKEKQFAVVYSNITDYSPVWQAEYAMSGLVGLFGVYIGRDFKIMEVHFMHAPPAHAAAYHSVFKAPVLFNMEQNALFIREEDLRLPVVSANPYLKAVFQKQAEGWLKKKSQKAVFREKVEMLVRSRLSSGNVSVESLSAEIGMDRTTLHRRLKKEGTSFSSILDQVRKDLAISYLERGWKIKDITVHLAFSDPSVFQRAFKRWFNMSAGRYQKMVSEKPDMSKSQANRTSMKLDQ